MAMPYIIYHNESIYSLEEKERAQLKKPPRYTSKFRPQVKSERETIKEFHRTMGYAETPLNPPDKYLKIGGGVHVVRKIEDHNCCQHVKHKASLPHSNNALRGKNKVKDQNDKSQAVIGCGADAAAAGVNNDECCNCDSVCADIKTDKQIDCSKANNNKTNFKSRNIRNVVSAKPHRPLPRYVDTRNGDSHNLIPSGLMPAYVYQPKYGKLPKYLIKRIRDVEKQEQEFRDEEARKNNSDTGCRYVTNQERIELINGLKNNWQELQQIYQGLPVLTDTLPKCIRKTTLENKLKQLEQDILLVENHPYIYVYDDEKN